MEKVQNQDSQEDAEKVPRELQTNTRRCRAERKKYGKSAEKVLREHRTHKQVPEKCGKSTERVKKVQKYDGRPSAAPQRGRAPSAPAPFVVIFLVFFVFLVFFLYFWLRICIILCISGRAPYFFAYFLGYCVRLSVRCPYPDLYFYPYSPAGPSRYFFGIVSANFIVFAILRLLGGEEIPISQ